MASKNTLDSLASSIQGIWSELKAFRQEQAANFVTLVKRLTGVESVLEKHTQLLESHTQLLESHTQLLESHTQLLESHTQLLEHLIKEVGALKHTDGNLMVTCFAFAAQEDLTFSQGDLAVNSKIAQRYCNRHRIRYAQVSDPRFGYVNVYPRAVLEQLFLQEDSREFTGWQTQEKTGARY